MLVLYLYQGHLNMRLGPSSTMLDLCTDRDPISESPWAVALLHHCLPAPEPVFLDAPLPDEHDALQCLAHPHQVPQEPCLPRRVREPDHAHLPQLLVPELAPRLPVYRPSLVFVRRRGGAGAAVPGGHVDVQRLERR